MWQVTFDARFFKKMYAFDLHLSHDFFKDLWANYEPDHLSNSANPTHVKGARMLHKKIRVYH